METAFQHLEAYFHSEINTLLCPTAKNGIKSCIFLPSGYDVCTECESAMHALFSEFCMDQSYGRQFERPRKRGRPLTYEEKWMVQHVFETLTKEKNAGP